MVINLRMVFAQRLKAHPPLKSCSTPETDHQAGSTKEFLGCTKMAPALRLHNLRLHESGSVQAAESSAAQEATPYRITLLGDGVLDNKGSCRGGPSVSEHFP